MEAFYEKSQEPVAVETEAFRIVGMKKEEEAVSAGTKKKKRTETSGHFNWWFWC